MDSSGWYRNIKWGPNEQLHLVGIDIGKSPDMVLNDTQRPAADGSIMGRDRRATRTINATFETKYLGKSALDAVVRNLDAAFMTRRDTVDPCYFDAGNWLAYVRPGPINVPRDDVTRAWQSARINVQWRAADPLFYGNENVVVIPVYQQSGGILAPVKAPIKASSTGAPGNATLDCSAGTAESAPYVVVQGPFSKGFIIENVSTTKQLQVNWPLAAGSWVAIDMGKPSIKEMGTATRIQYKEKGSDFWTLVPDINAIRLRAIESADAGAQAFLKYRLARLAL